MWRPGIGSYVHIDNYTPAKEYRNDSFRMECLEKVQNREADFLAADPEDMYVAFNLKNEDFSIVSELRTVSLKRFLLPQ